MATLALVVAALSGAAGAQVLNSGASTITLQAVLSQSLSLTLIDYSHNYLGSTAERRQREGVRVLQQFGFGADRWRWQQYSII